MDDCDQAVDLLLSSQMVNSFLYSHPAGRDPPRAAVSAKCRQPLATRSSQSSKKLKYHRHAFSSAWIIPWTQGIPDHETGVCHQNVALDEVKKSFPEFSPQLLLLPPPFSCLVAPSSSLAAE